ncbi:hypothetical protein Ddc_01999 [Ditylenchus destructor]|nr:hypothetical protein Ddc_01999 [Ditylenchus destructor]
MVRVKEIQACGHNYVVCPSIVSASDRQVDDTVRGPFLQRSSEKGEKEHFRARREWNSGKEKHLSRPCRY